MMSRLNQPFELRSLKLSSRVVMAPMTRSMSPNNIPGENVALYYERRAKGGVGLIVSEGTSIDHPASPGYPDVPNFYGREALQGWKNVLDRVHKAGGKMFPQLWHVGSVRQRKMHNNSGVDNPSHVCSRHNVPGYGPSPIVHPYVPGGEVPHEMTKEDIQAVVAAFAKGAKDAKELGFDGVELHGAHGYLIDQFFWDVTNKRKDEYGADKTRFAVEVIQAVRKAVGPNYPVMLRYSQFKLGDYEAKLFKTPFEMELFLKPLVDAGVDIFHCSTRSFAKPEFPGSPLNLAGWTKKLTGKPTVTVGSVGLNIDFVGGMIEGSSKTNLKYLEECLDKGEFDLVAVGRALLADPEWFHKMEKGEFDKIKPFSKELLKVLY